VSVEPATQRNLPFAVLADSPVLSQLLLPASRIPDVLKAILNLEDKHFDTVRVSWIPRCRRLPALRRRPYLHLQKLRRFS
jgi:hypothetical protein